MDAFPASVAALDPDWLTRVLRKGGCIDGARVTAVSAEGIGAEVGFLDSVARLTLTYDPPDAAAPATLVAKLSSAVEVYRRIGNFYGAYEREFHFYESVAPRSPIRLPRCYAREADPATGAHLLLLEDLGSLAAGDQLKGLTPAEAGAAAEAIGRFHAYWWDSPELDSLAWMPRRNLHPPRYLAAWPDFRAAFGPHLPAAAVALGDRLAVQLESLLGEVERGPHTIAHSDFRADNLLFDLPTRPQPVVVLDWQLAIRGPGVLDLARLLCGSLSPRDRAACELDVLRRWHAALEHGGVQDYSFERAWDDYRACSLICLYYPVTVHLAEEAAGRRGAALARSQIERFFAAAMDLTAPPA